jgi:hypothetical protein
MPRLAIIHGSCFAVCRAAQNLYSPEDYVVVTTKKHETAHDARQVVFVATPFLPEDKYFDFAREAMLHSLMRNEAPIISNLLYLQVLNQNRHPDWIICQDAADALLLKSAKLVYYSDLGISPEMEYHIANAQKLGIHVEERKLYNA